MQGNYSAVSAKRRSACLATTTMTVSDSFQWPVIVYINTVFFGLSTPDIVAVCKHLFCIKEQRVV